MTSQSTSDDVRVKTGSFTEDLDEFAAMLEDLDSVNYPDRINMANNKEVANEHAHNGYINGNTDSSLDDEGKGRSDKAEAEKKRLMEMLYTIDETPAWYLCVILGLQHCMTCFGSNLSVAIIVAPAMCIFDDIIVSQILGTIFFMAGMVTLLQCTFGIRLPLVQGATFAFIVPTFAILNLPQWKCPTVSIPDTGTENQSYTTVTPDLGLSTENSTNSGADSSDSVWKSRMLEIQGAIILSSLFEVVLGMSGLVGIMVRYIGPLVIGPTITLVGLSCFPAASNFACKNWYIAILTSLLILIFSQYMRFLKVPICKLDENRKCSRTSYPIFTLFPVILAIILSWGLCGILTITNAIPNDPSHWSYRARTDVKIQVLNEAAWFRFPYPFQWGIPTFSVGSVFGMLAGVIAGAIESIGDYYSCARLAGAPPPPVHAVNRGILIEGVGCVLAGMWGSGSGSTTYSENIGAIGITKVASRRVIQFEALFMMMFGILGKFGALFVTIPEPVIGGVFMALSGIITSVGVSNLQYVDLNSSRNLCIYGFSVFFGLAFPQWLRSGDNVNSINTGSEIVDQIFGVLLSTSMFVGGAIGFILDNTIPGSKKERGLLEWRANLKGSDSKTETASNHNQTLTIRATLASFESGISDTSSGTFPKQNGDGPSKTSNNDVITEDAKNRINDVTTRDTINSNSNAYNNLTLNNSESFISNSKSDNQLLKNDQSINQSIKTSQSINQSVNDKPVEGENVDNLNHNNFIPSELVATKSEVLKKNRSRTTTLECYEIPAITKHLRRWPITRYIPISPTFLQKFSNSSDSNLMENGSTASRLGERDGKGWKIDLNGEGEEKGEAEEEK